MRRAGTNDSNMRRTLAPRRTSSRLLRVCLICILVTEIGSLACSSTHGAPVTGAAPTDGGGVDASKPPATTGDGGCDLGVPAIPEGCLGADAGGEMISSDGKPTFFAFAAPDPATGDWQVADGSTVAQVFFSSAEQTWEANLLSAFDQPNPAPMAVLKGTPSSCTTMSLSGGGWTATLQGGHLTFQNGAQSLDMQRVGRVSPTLCAAPPAGAVVLFDGTNFDQWATITPQNWLQPGMPSEWNLVGGAKGGAMEVVPDAASIVTKQVFGACTIHVEFRTLGAPTHSGVFPEARYQTTVLETYGLLTGNATGNFGNESPVVNPSIHAERPPLMWQTLDIDFVPPGAAGGADGGASGPVATVRLNGITIFDHYALKPPTGAASSYPPAATGPILLEYHGMRVQYRNVWVLPASP
jgi:hypothetical protein